MGALRRIVFVADDLGIAPGTNAGIAAAARAGLVREASLCVTGAAVGEGVRLARELGLGVGLHLCLSAGRALSGPIRGLTDSSGAFRGVASGLAACSLARVDAAGVAREVAAQLAALRGLGIAPTHCNGHHHAHCWPVVREVAFAACARAGIAWTRLPAEVPAAGGRWRPVRLLLAALARGARGPAAAAGMRALPFVGLSLFARADHGDRFLQAVGRLPAGDYECMVHPRQPDDAFARFDRKGHRLDDTARAELATLAAPATRAALAAAAIEPVAYADLGR